jgi:hypothetical protein
MDYNLSGGSLASNHVSKLAEKRCSLLKGGVHHHSKHKKSNKKSMKKYSNKSKKSKVRKVKSKKIKSKKSKMKGGGSDWISTLYSRGPVNNQSTYNKQLLRKFSKTGEFYDSQGKLNKRGNISGGRRKPSKKVKRSKKYSRK